MAANNKITHLLLPREGDADLPTNPITVTFTPSFSNDAGVDVASGDEATHIKLTPGVGGDMDWLKASTNQETVTALANNIGVAKNALNAGLPTPEGLRGLNEDGTTFSGGKKSKSKKHAKSKKQKKRKSVRRR